MQNLSLAIKNFNDRVKTMNQTNSRQLVLNADEARNLHSDIYALLSNLAEIQTKMYAIPTEQPTQVSLDGGSF